MADNPFRVLLDVTELYINYLKYVWVNVSPVQLKNISDFKASIREKLNLGNKDIKIFVREGLLLDEETITVLRENDTVKVQYNELCSSAAKSLTKKQKKRQKKRNYSECTNDAIMDSKRCKIDNISKEINDSVDQNKKHKKSNNSPSTGNLSCATCYAESLKESIVAEKNEKKGKKDIKIAENYVGSCNTDQTLENSGNSTNSTHNLSCATCYAESLKESTHIVVEKYEKKGKEDIKMAENYVSSCNMDQTLENSGNRTNSCSITFEKKDSDVIKKHKKKDKEKSDVLEMTTDDNNTNNDIFISFANVDSMGKQLENISSSAITVDPGTFTKDLSKGSQNSNDISEVDVNISAGTSKNSQKKKRKRHRKRKSTVSADINTGQNVDADSFSSFDIGELKFDFVAPTVLQDPDARSKSVSFSNNEETVKRKHIVYSPVPCEAERKPVEIHNNTKEIHNSSNNTYVVKEDVSTVNAQSFKNYPKVSTPNQPNKCKNLSWHVSMMQSAHSVTNNEPQISEKEDIKNIVEKQSSVKRNTSKKEKSNIECEDLPPLNSFPEIGTHIMYKILELDDSYSPVVSEYREGLVKSVNHDTQEIEIELIKEVVKPGRTGKFENLKEDENPSPEIIRCDTVQWSSLISPKRMY